MCLKLPHSSCCKNSARYIENASRFLLNFCINYYPIVWIVINADTFAVVAHASQALSSVRKSNRVLCPRCYTIISMLFDAIGHLIKTSKCNFKNSN